MISSKPAIANFAYTVGIFKLSLSLAIAKTLGFVPVGGQTRKNRYEHWLNSQELFKLNNTELIEGKHILIADDIITTGATAESFAQLLTEVPGVKISFAALAVSL